MQATVRTFSPLETSGTVLLDDGRELPFDAAAFRSSGLRLLRPGQRVRIAVDGATEGATEGAVEAGARVTRLSLATLPLPEKR